MGNASSSDGERNDGNAGGRGDGGGGGGGGGGGTRSSLSSRGLGHRITGGGSNYNSAISHVGRQTLLHLPVSLPMPFRGGVGNLGLSRAELDTRCQPSGWVSFISFFSFSSASPFICVPSMYYSVEYSRVIVCPNRKTHPRPPPSNSSPPTSAFFCSSTVKKKTNQAVPLLRLGSQTHTTPGLQRTPSGSIEGIRFSPREDRSRVSHLLHVLLRNEPIEVLQRHGMHRVLPPGQAAEGQGYDVPVLQQSEAMRYGTGRDGRGRRGAEGGGGTASDRGND